MYALISEQIFVIENLRQSSAFSLLFLKQKLAFRQLFLSKERYNVSKRILRFTFADYERQTLYDLYAISAFNISDINTIKVCF